MSSFIIVGGSALAGIAQLIMGIASLSFLFGILTGLMSDNWMIVKYAIGIGVVAFLVQLITQAVVMSMVENSVSNEPQEIPATKKQSNKRKKSK